jgi:hypothetical protein
MAVALHPMSHRSKMYEVPPWRRREVARAGGVKFESRDSGRYPAALKAERRAKSRQADRALAQDGATWT